MHAAGNDDVVGNDGELPELRMRTGVDKTVCGHGQKPGQDGTFGTYSRI